MYAFTVLLNELLLEEEPLTGLSADEIKETVVTRRQRPRGYTAHTSDEVGCGLIQLINRGWNQDPALRPLFDAITQNLRQILSLSLNVAEHGVVHHTPAADVDKEEQRVDYSSKLSISEWLSVEHKLSPGESTALATALMLHAQLNSVEVLKRAETDFVCSELRKMHLYHLKQRLHSINKRKPLSGITMNELFTLLVNDESDTTIDAVLATSTFRGEIFNFVLFF